MMGHSRRSVRAFVAVAATAAFSLTPVVAMASASTAPPKLTVRLQGPALRVAGGAALLVRVAVQCPTGYSLAGGYSPGGVSVTQTINRTRFESGGQDFLFWSAVTCDGKLRVITVPVFPNQPSEFGGGNLPALPWSRNNAAVYATLDACPLTGECFPGSGSPPIAGSDRRIIAVRDASAAESRGGNNIPGITVAVPSVVTRQAAGVQVKVPVPYSCDRSLPPPVQFEGLLGQVTTHQPRVVNGSSSDLPATATGLCNGQSHQLTLTESPATSRPWATGQAFLLTAGYYCASVASGTVCSGSSAWSPVQVKNPAG